MHHMLSYSQWISAELVLRLMHLRKAWQLVAVCWLWQQLKDWNLPCTYVDLP